MPHQSARPTGWVEHQSSVSQEGILDTESCRNSVSASDPLKSRGDNQEAAKQSHGHGGGDGGSRDVQAQDDVTPPEGWPVTKEETGNTSEEAIPMMTSQTAARACRWHRNQPAHGSSGMAPLAIEVVGDLPPAPIPPPLDPTEAHPRRTKPTHSPSDIVRALHNKHGTDHRIPTVETTESLYQVLLVDAAASSGSREFALPIVDNHATLRRAM